MLNNKYMNFLATSLVAFAINGCTVLQENRDYQETQKQIVRTDYDSDGNKISDQLEQSVSQGNHPLYPFEYNPNLPNEEQALVDVLVKFDRQITRDDKLAIKLFHGEYSGTMLNNTVMRLGLPKSKLAQYAQLKGVVLIEGNY